MKHVKSIKKNNKTFETQIRVKMCHIQRKTVSILTIQHVYLDLAPPCQNFFEINQTCVKYKKERKRTIKTKIRVKMCHIQRKTVSILTIPHVYLDLAPPCQKKSEIG